MSLTFIIRVKDNFGIRLECGCKSLPIGLESSDIRNHFAIVSTVIVWHNHSICSLLCNMIDDL
jgi:hypothetical protein